ncbi:MAG: hypothetical protein Q6354_01070, partial [Candidatus Brocadiales bacterium]|nr:hypothetical protein [Candidatus Brocadiales bacterium]
MPYLFPGTRVTCIFTLVIVVILSSVTASKIVHGKRKEAGVGESFHQETRLTLTGMVGSIFRWRTQPAQYKSYPGKEKVKLPA